MFKDYTVIKANRKTIGIKVCRDGTVKVRAPRYATRTEIERVVSEHTNFILRNREKLLSVSEKRSGFRVSIGSRLLYLGKEYPLCEKAGNSVGFDGECFYAPKFASASEEAVKAALVKVYKNLAKAYIPLAVTQETERIRTSIGITLPTVKSVSINSAKTRWGSCSGRNTLNFSWRLIMADEAAVHYVVIHELSHTIEHNHSDRFWDKVSDFMPNYKDSEKSLKKLSERLGTEMWETED